MKKKVIGLSSWRMGNDIWCIFWEKIPDGWWLYNFARTGVIK